MRFEVDPTRLSIFSVDNDGADLEFIGEDHATHAIIRRRIQRTVCFAVDQTRPAIFSFDNIGADLEVIRIDRVTHPTVWT